MTMTLRIFVAADRATHQVHKRLPLARFCLCICKWAALGIEGTGDKLCPQPFFTEAGRLPNGYFKQFERFKDSGIEQLLLVQPQGGLAQRRMNHFFRKLTIRYPVVERNPLVVVVSAQAG